MVLYIYSYNINSAKLIAVIASTTGTILIAMQGSCLPLISILTFSPLSQSIVFCFKPIEGVGLTASLNTIGIPVEIPPIIPAELFE